MSESFDSAGLHGRELDPRRQRGQGNVLQRRPPSTSSSTTSPEVGRARQAVLDSRHPETSEEVLLLFPGHQPRPGHHLATQPGLQLPDVVVDVLLQAGVAVLLQSLPVSLLEKIFLNIFHFLKISIIQLT